MTEKMIGSKQPSKLAQEEPTEIRLPKRLQLHAVLQLLRTPDGREKLFALMKKEYGSVNPLSVDNLYDLLYQFGLVAPIGEWQPPAGAPVRHINMWIDVEPGETKRFSFNGAMSAGRVNKYKEFTVTPENVTAIDSLLITQYVGASKAYASFLMNPACGDEQRGIFTTWQNLNVPFGACMVVELENTDANSLATVRIEGIAWEA